MTTVPDRDQAAALGFTGLGIRQCRGHWHPCWYELGEEHDDIDLPGDPFKTREEAERAVLRHREVVPPDYDPFITALAIGLHQVECKTLSADEFFAFATANIRELRARLTTTEAALATATREREKVVSTDHMRQLALSLNDTWLNCEHISVNQIRQVMMGLGYNVEPMDSQFACPSAPPGEG